MREVKELMELVVDLDQIVANLLVLEKGRNRHPTAYETLLRLGICFLPYQNTKGIAFAPSRFIGYDNASFERYEAHERGNGRETNIALSSILGCRPSKNQDFETKYRAFCENIGVRPKVAGAFGVARQYWPVIRAPFSSFIPTPDDADSSQGSNPL